MQLRLTATRCLAVSGVCVGIAALLCAVTGPASCAGSVSTTGEGANSPATTLPRTVAVDTSNPEVQRQARQLAREPAVLPPRGHRVVEDHSGRKELGKASVYAPRFEGRKMANGQAFDQKGREAASKSLPLGTVAKVTNLQNGHTALVTVEDHGPYVDGRVVDVTTATARKLGITKRQGIVPVVVAPVAVPQPNGTVKVGAGAVPGPATTN